MGVFVSPTNRDGRERDGSFESPPNHVWETFKKRGARRQNKRQKTKLRGLRRVDRMWGVLNIQIDKETKQIKPFATRSKHDDACEFEVSNVSPFFAFWWAVVE